MLALHFQSVRQYNGTIRQGLLESLSAGHQRYYTIGTPPTREIHEGMGRESESFLNEEAETREWILDTPPDIGTKLDVRGSKSFPEGFVSGNGEIEETTPGSIKEIGSPRKGESLSGFIPRASEGQNVLVEVGSAKDSERTTEPGIIRSGQDDVFIRENGSPEVEEGRTFPERKSGGTRCLCRIYLAIDTVGL